ncbi:hypothetical protein H072_3914 [Dactylellina haptotyla CBS 200.50]|uniref:Uncharacterized protein n=1 Tax=Dactylellina haptotyla (strain CBS 200.50) TaxID=1284197 RepID=S8AM44_DACHA|nr:hypothetical protein H072_3914 [Dactylellina haptotyla CBS 200.50]
MGIKSALKNSFSAGSKPKHSSSKHGKLLKGLGKSFGSSHRNRPFIQGSTGISGHWTKKNSIVLAAVMGLIAIVAVLLIAAIKFRRTRRNKTRDEAAAEAAMAVEDRRDRENRPTPMGMSGITSAGLRSSCDLEKVDGTRHDSHNTTPSWNPSDHTLSPEFGVSKFTEGQMLEPISCGEEEVCPADTYISTEIAEPKAVYSQDTCQDVSPDRPRGCNE